MKLQGNKYDRKERRASLDLTTMVYGKVPPQAKEIEMVVLGAIMLERDAFDIVNEVLKAECFYVNAHQLIFKAICDLHKVGQPVDELTVYQQLIKQGDLENIGGPYYITQLTKSVVSAANIEEHSRIIYEKYLGRKMIELSGQTINDAYDDQVDIFDLIGDHEKSLTELTTGSMQTTYSGIDVTVVHSLQRIETLRSEERDLTGIPSGFGPLDQVTYGWQETDLIILAARPAVGKTAFALNLATSAARAKEPVAFFSMEMSKGQLTNRILSSESEIWLESISRGKLSDQDYHKVFNVTSPAVSNLPIFFDDTPALTIMDLTSRCRRMKRKENIKLIIVDYLQLMSGDSDRGGNREQEISRISRGLKKLAKELQVPIIALSQLSRAVESRSGDKRMPQLSDLRESGAIEQDADMVMFMYRPEYYDTNANEMGESTKGETHIRIAKHRNGALETVKLRAQLHIQKFGPWEENTFTPPPGLPTGNGERWKAISNQGDNDKDLPF